MPINQTMPPAEPKGPEVSMLTPDEQKTFEVLRKKFESNTRAGYGQQYVDTTKKMLLQKNPGRKQLYLEADSANTDTIYLGMDLFIDNITYFRALQPHDNFSMDNFAGEIWVYAPSGTQKIQYAEW